MKHRLIYRAEYEIEADSRAEAEEKFEDDGPEIGRGVKLSHSSWQWGHPYTSEEGTRLPSNGGVA